VLCFKSLPLSYESGKSFRAVSDSQKSLTDVALDHGGFTFFGYYFELLHLVTPSN